MGGIGHVASKAWGYAQRGFKVYGTTVFGTGSDVMGKAYKDALTTKNPLNKQFYKDIWTGTKNAGRAAEVHNAAQVAKHGNFWKSFVNSIKTTPKKIAQGWKVGGYQATKAGKNALLGNIKGVFKGIGSKMPLISSLMLLAFELPNIFKATKDEGVIQGATETVKAGARIAGGTLGAAIGSAALPVVGTIVGWIVGEWLTSKVVGKSYSEKTAAKEEALAASQQTQQIQTPMAPQIAGGQISNTGAVTPEQIMAYQQMLNATKNPMNDDFMANSFMQQQPQFNIQA